MLSALLCGYEYVNTNQYSLYYSQGNVFAFYKLQQTLPRIMSRLFIALNLTSDFLATF